MHYYIETTGNFCQPRLLWEVEHTEVQCTPSLSLCLGERSLSPLLFQPMARGPLFCFKEWWVLLP